MESVGRLGVMWGLRAEVDGLGGEQAPWAGEELGLIPTGAWLEVAVGPGTPPPALLAPHTDPGVCEGQRAPTSQCPSLSLHPTPAFLAPRPLWLLLGVFTGVLLRSDSGEDAGVLDFSSLLKKR